MRRLILLGIMAAIGGGIGYLASFSKHMFMPRRHYRFLDENIALPHHVPKYPGALTLRLAMIHDVLHERFPKHGPAYYQSREKAARERLATLSADDPERFALADDIGVGLDRQGRSDEAVALLREKLKAQQAKGLSGRELYTSYANLGTFLIHGSFKKAQSGDADAKARFAEGVALVRKSIEVNPQAHYGREQWQAAIAEFLFAAMSDPKLLTTFDCLGNRLDRPIEDIFATNQRGEIIREGRPTNYAFNSGDIDRDVVDLLKLSPLKEDATTSDRAKQARTYVQKIGAEREWDKVDVPSHRKPTPFDEPMLGIIGMWRQGGGANPHFALAIGESMLRVGQRYIAWSAFERASQLSERFWPDKTIGDAFRKHCQDRMNAIEDSLKQTKAILANESRTELMNGLAYQEAYQAFEKSQLAAGVAFDDPAFFHNFDQDHPSIASRVGLEERHTGVMTDSLVAFRTRQHLAWTFFGASLAVFLTTILRSVYLSLRNRLRSNPEVLAEQNLA